VPNLQDLADDDVKGLQKAAKSYGNSWKKRGGVGAFMMLARKWDRLENQVEKHRYDIFEAIANDQCPEGIIDDIRDLRRYLLLVDEHMANVEAGLKVTISDVEVPPEGYQDFVEKGISKKIDPDRVPQPYSLSRDPIKKLKAGMENPFGYDPEQDDV